MNHADFIISSTYQVRGLQHSTRLLQGTPASVLLRSLSLSL
jgi:hypothetical protein